MGYVRPKFPDEIWDGSTTNPERAEGVNADCYPNTQDWDRIAAEVIATQQKVLALESEGIQGQPGGPGEQGPRGPQGNPGVSFVWRGPWAAETVYAVNDAVSHNGSAYVAVAESTGSEPPSENWNTLAEKGDQGESGTQGEPGPAYVPDPSALANGAYVLQMTDGVASWVAHS